MSQDLLGPDGEKIGTITKMTKRCIFFDAVWSSTGKIHGFFINQHGCLGQYAPINGLNFYQPTLEDFGMTFSQQADWIQSLAKSVNYNSKNERVLAFK